MEEQAKVAIDAAAVTTTVLVKAIQELTARIETLEG